ncbi:rhamnulokinase [Kiritimatiellota bacterium B12222]|nr:rhamnulokinase [Kiritimatiellota bacterium B12222]
MNTHSTSPVYLAVDFGAGSGRVIAGIFDQDTLLLEEVHRFSNHGINLAGTWHWKVSSQFTHILEGLEKAATQYGDRIRSVGIDTWGVDYGLIDASGSLLGIPVQYRDARTDGKMEDAFKTISAQELYQATGNQFMPFNTLFQFLAEQSRNPGRLAAAERFLLIPDLFNFWLTGNASNEATNASTTQLVNAATGEWAWDVIDLLKLPRKLFQKITPPGTSLGDVLPHIAQSTGLKAKVVTVGSHDTAAAYAAVPTNEENAVFLSSGTWSLLGTLVENAVITDESFKHAFTNERAVGGKIRLLKNICGMWLIQECKRTWDEQGDCSWETLIAEAEAAPAFVSLIDPDDPRLASPCDMPTRLNEVCEATGQPVPASRGALTRMIFESMALKYRIVFDNLQKVVGYKLGTFHVVGGGCQNALLNQFTANALQKQVVAGPVEATAAGNLLSQLMADNQIASLREGSELIRRSFEVKTFDPETSPEWPQALHRYQNMMA